MNVNVSLYISKEGGLVVKYNNVEEGALIRYIQGVQGEEHNELELLNIKQTVSFINLINNSLTTYFFNPYQTSLKVIKGCFFLNNVYNERFNVESFDWYQICIQSKPLKFHLQQFWFKVVISSHDFNHNKEFKYRLLVDFCLQLRSSMVI